VAAGAVTVVVAASAGCGAVPDRPERRASSVVYGADDRKEYFDVASPEERSLMAESMVALVPRSALSWSEGNAVVAAPSWGEAGNLCAGERFADQPAGAFCSGVLVDWDLVLTAGHCVRLLALKDFAIVFGYYYAQPGHLALGRDVATPVSIVSEALDPGGAEPRLDYAWLRLEHPVGSQRRPAPTYVRPASLARGDSLVSIGTGGGVPAKLDDGGEILDNRAAQADYFVADTDTVKGSSGGGGFDHGLNLAGVLVRGQMDLVPTDAGCNATVQLPDADAGAGEEFTYAHRAVEGLCASGLNASSLCRADCENPCQALPPRNDASGLACSVTACPPGSALDALYAAMLLGVSLLWRRRVPRTSVRSSRRGTAPACAPRFAVL
jgi:Trypsin-like peptidase domain